jgi:hypothetical protein
MDYVPAVELVRSTDVGHPPPHITPSRRRPVGVVLALFTAALLLASPGCGDEASEGTPAGAGGTGVGTPTSTTLDPSNGAATVPDLPQNDDPSMVVCTGKPKKGEGPGVFDATVVIGDPIGDAEKAAARQGCQIRVAVIDGEPQALTEDFRPDRLNVAIEAGEVTEIISIG